MPVLMPAFYLRCASPPTILIQIFLRLCVTTGHLLQVFLITPGTGNCSPLGVWLVSLSWHLIVALYDHYGFNMSYLSCCVVNAIRVETIHVCLFFIVHYIIIVLLHCLLIMFITSIEQILWQHIIYYLVHNRYFAVF